ncbi:hypothetical protein [Amycolatopsis azurea]|uniref:Uncharacterized protein n=1 Tax=Amycolatopsis azurea DSM 43854 TaxID=1238180 RepID=M2Q8H6_9PSEU|nr:hypothetical protein [Amycolatopsis azurea]EMD22956.1 hypothetical protein C791_7838 [Amycolatopsis azurea DSM 43854]
MASSIAIGLGLAAALGAALSLRASIRALRRAGLQVDTILAEELDDRPPQHP